MLPDPQIDPALAAHVADPWGWVPPEWSQPAPAAPIDLAPAPAPAPLTDAAVAPPPATDLVAPVPAPPPDVAPDAVTAAAPLPGVADLHGFNVSTLPPPTRADEVLANPLAMQDNGPLAPSPAFGEQEVNKAVDQIALQGGPQLEQIAVDREMARRAKLAADTARIETENLRQQQLNADAYKAALAHAQEKSDQITADAIALSNRKTDPDRLVNRMTGGQTVAQLIALAMGGLIAGRTGGPNVAMDLLQRRIDRDIDAQKADIENARFGINIRRSAVADEYARHGDLFRAGETVRLATYQSALNVMAAEQQNFDPRGSQAIERGRVMQRWAAMMAQSHEAQRKTTFEETLKTIKADQEERELKRKTAETASTIEKNRAETAKLYSEASNAKADKTVWSPDQLGVLNPGLPRPPIPMSQADYTKWLGTQRQGEEAKTAARANDPHELAIQRSVPGVVDDKGQLVQFADKDLAAKISDAKESTDETVRLTDELINMVTRNGWSSDLIKSKEWRQAKQNYNEILIRKKETDKLGVLTGPDVGIVTKEIGTEDPTEVRGQQVIDALKHFRTNQVEGFNSKIRNKAIVGEGRRVARWEPPPLDTAPHEQSIEEIQLQKLVQDPSTDLTQVQSLAAAERQAHDDPSNETFAALKAAHDAAANASQWQRDTIAQLATVATGAADDPAAMKARETLGAVAAKGQTTTLRSLAKAALEQAGLHQADSGAALPDRGVAHETAPPPRRGGK
ncbi:MAG: hypothetical protein ACM358_11870 [Gemmatimonadota bacterium]